MATHYEKYDQLIETNLKEIDLEFIKTIQINKDKFHLFFYDYYHENIKDKLHFKILMNLFHFKRQMEAQLEGNLLFVFQLQEIDKRIKYLEYDPNSDFGKYINTFL